jgi:acyl-CoA dehydrogenase
MTTPPADGMPTTRGTNLLPRRFQPRLRLRERHVPRRPRARPLDGADAGSATDQALIRIVTPLTKYWLTARARVVAGEAMSVRGGNGYIEEWVNARLVPDAYLGTIREGATNVVALDVQRAILRAGAFEPLAAFVQSRLDRVTEPRARRWADVVAATLADLRRRVATWPGLDTAGRELEARPVADALYHALAGALLLAEGQALWHECQSARKLVAGALYVRKWLRPPASPVSVFTARECDWLPALVDWTPVPAEALADPAGGC